MKILKTEQLTNEKYLNLFKTQADNNGYLLDWIWASRNRNKIKNNPDAVIIVPFDVENKSVIMVEEFRIPVGDYEWSFPAGLLDPDECPVEAAKRELEEETGYVVTKLLCTSPLVFSSGGLSDESVCFVFVECKMGGKQKLELAECLNVKPIPYCELNDFLFSDKKISAKCWPVLYGLIMKSPF